MKTLKHIHIRPAGWIAIAVGLGHFAVTLLEAQCFFGGSEYTMFWVETFPAILWFPVSQFVDPTDITVPMQYFPLLGAWLFLLAFLGLSTAWGLYAYCTVRMIVSPDQWNRRLVATFGGYGLLIAAFWFIPVPAALLALLALVGVVGALGSIIAAVAIRRTAWPAMLFVAANMATGAYFGFMGWVLVSL